MLTTGYVLTVLICAGLLVIGARFLFQPRSAAVGYGVPADPPGAPAYLTIKGLRDGSLGLLVGVLAITAGAHPLGWFLLVAAVIPAGDVLIVLRHGGSRLTAFAIHGGTAVLTVITALLLLFS